jgi:hypothetical protein
MVPVDGEQHIRRCPSVCPSIFCNHVGPSPIGWEAHKVHLLRPVNGWRAGVLTTHPTNSILTDH